MQNYILIAVLAYALIGIGHYLYEQRKDYRVVILWLPYVLCGIIELIERKMSRDE